MKRGARLPRDPEPEPDAGADPFRHPSTRALVRLALEEDVGRGDVTTTVTIPRGCRGTAVLAARESCIVAGLPLLDLVFAELAVGEAPRVRAVAREGELIAKGAVLAEVEGDLAVLLTGERVLLNLVQSLCGVATLTRRFVDAVAGTGAIILDTRKTTPGLRLLQKYAVRMGGGRNHRFGLDDAILIKDNHVAACGSVRVAVERARALGPIGLRVEVECDRLEQVGDALAAGADIVLLDNMRPEQVRAARTLVGTRALLEVSGGVRLETVRDLAAAGADFVSVGRLTHSAPAIDLGLDLAPLPSAQSTGRRASQRRAAAR